ncbi:ABC transporter ATP-binding protein [Natronorarus salvus]|uniref:ABC transporter ATP-binding protein n=1 Tax=Natronorarus salvus TaxID=3117733 RepID=UPI002F260954
MLETKNLKKLFGNLAATDGVDFQLGQTPDEVVFIVGPNGAGKTTLVNLITGHLSPDSGMITLDGEEITALDPTTRVNRGIIRSFQIVNLFDEMTVRDNVRITVLSNHGITKSLFSLKDEHEVVESEVEYILDTFGLNDISNEVAAELSHGQRKLLDVAMTFGLEPRYLFLDEPTAGIPSGMKVDIIETILEVSRREEIPIATIEHDMELVLEYADRVVALHEGKVLREGPADLIREDNELRRKLLGVKA